MRIPVILHLLTLILSLLALSPFAVASQRETLSLDGLWEINDSIAADEIPGSFPSKIPVPGLTHLAKPAFKDVGRFMDGANRKGLLPSQVEVIQERNYFWYRTRFRTPRNPSQIALLEIKKAQFGTAVWLNDQKIGEYAGCFSASRFHLAEAIRWGEENILIVRVGAHPAVLPDSFPTGTDLEKLLWAPGIYDSVSISFCDNPLIESVQVAPRIASGEIIVQTRLRNLSDKALKTTLSHSVHPWKDDAGRPIQAKPLSVEIPANGEHTFTQNISIPEARLWSPDSPFLYVLDSRTEGDSFSTRFGMREFRFDRELGLAILNGEPIRLRGSNITLHRFFEDPLCGNLPWDESWVRRLLGEWPKKIHWNFFRFCIGPVPDRWLDICDEEGLLIQNEFFIWTSSRREKGQEPYPYDQSELIRQYADWMRDNWNHPSVVIWDANNETEDPVFGEKIIPAVRPLDLSKRPWENSYNTPMDPNDPVEVHPYLFRRVKPFFEMTQLEKMDGMSRIRTDAQKGHPVILNEYGWIWLNRDGSPTELTKRVYPKLLPPEGGTARERLDLWAYLLAGKTEFWRARRHHAGIVHFVYLTSSFPGAFTSDHWADVPKLIPDPAFMDYVAESFKPLGVYINFFQPEIKAGSKRDFAVTLVNDYNKPLKGTLELSLAVRGSGKVVTKASRSFALDSDGNQTLNFDIKIPDNISGEDYILTATASANDIPVGEATRSRRWLKIVPAEDTSQHVK